jgi:hypothetical protein
MQRFLCIAAGLAALSWALAAPAPALEPGAAPRVPAIAPAEMPGPAAEGRRGVTCTPIGCFRAPSSPWSALAGFGAAALAAGWIARRQSSHPS